MIDERLNKTPDTIETVQTNGRQLTFTEYPPLLTQHKRFLKPHVNSSENAYDHKMRAKTSTVHSGFEIVHRLVAPRIIPADTFTAPDRYIPWTRRSSHSQYLPTIRFVNVLQTKTTQPTDRRVARDQTNMYGFIRWSGQRTFLPATDWCRTASMSSSSLL